MAQPVVDTGTGATLTITNDTTFGAVRIESMERTGFAFKSIDKTHLGSVNFLEKFRSDLADLGQLKITFQFNPDKQPLFTTNQSDTYKVTFPPFGTNTGTNASKDTFTGYFLSFDHTIPLENKMMGTAVFEFDGGYTHVNAT